MARLRSLYVCYLSLDDPLVHSQVVAYLRGLAAAGHRIHLLTFETRRLTWTQRRTLRAALAGDGISWHGLRYHKRPSLPATVYDTLAGAVCAALLVRRHRLDALHARSHVPAAMALIARRLCWPRRVALIFDIRGLMAEEYVDAGRWRPGGVPFRLTKAVEHAAIARAKGIVVLTETIRRRMFADRRDAYTIPCCADLESLRAADARRNHTRAVLGLADATVMIYVGKFGGWYMAAEMARFFALAQNRIPRLHFLILTQGDPNHIRLALERLGVHTGYTITSSRPERLGDYLAAADFGISFIRPAPSKASSSPTKIGEYLGAGLPVVCTAGVGDLDELITPGIGWLVSEHDELSYAAAIDHCMRLVASADTRERCRAVAREQLSLADIGIPRYRRCYEEVAERR